MRTEHLTSRQMEVLALMADGLSNAEIAQRLFLSRARVKVVLWEVYAELGLTGRHGQGSIRVRATNRARELGLIPCTCRRTDGVL
jgi:DNA-binding NarL/FixJ family response regulator